MNRDVENKRRGLQKLINLKIELLSAGIANLQSEENVLNETVEFQKKISSEWLGTGAFSQVNKISKNIECNRLEIEKIRMNKKELQYEELALKIAKKKFSF